MPGMIYFVREEHHNDGWYYFWECSCHSAGVPPSQAHTIRVGPYPEPQANNAMNDANGQCQAGCPD